MSAKKWHPITDGIDPIMQALAAVMNCPPEDFFVDAQYASTNQSGKLAWALNDPEGGANGFGARETLRIWLVAAEQPGIATDIDYKIAVALGKVREVEHIVASCRVPVTWPPDQYLQDRYWKMTDQLDVCHRQVRLYKEAVAKMFKVASRGGKRSRIVKENEALAIIMAAHAAYEAARAQGTPAVFPTKKEIADSVGVTERTLRRWDSVKRLYAKVLAALRVEPQKDPERRKPTLTPRHYSKAEDKKDR